MGKIRIYELSQQLGRTNAEILQKLKELGLKVKFHTSSIDDEVAEKVRQLFREKAEKKAKPTKAHPTEEAKTPPSTGPARVKKGPARKQADTKVAEAAVEAPPADKKKKPTLKPSTKEKITRTKEQKAKAAALAEAAEGKPRRVRSAAGRKTEARAEKPEAAAPEVAKAEPSAPPAKSGAPERAHAAPAERPSRGAPHPAPATPARKAPEKPAPVPPPAPPPVKEVIHLTEGVTVKELAAKLNVKSKDIIKKLMLKGILVTINQTFDAETAIQICKEYGYQADIVTFEEDALLEAEETKKGDVVLAPREPVVTVMGHVDHGKTSLLDAIRQSNVVSTEAGNITQHIGAYHVTVNDRSVVFIDTPGHEAFTRMRLRGAQVTDIVVLVVAADDGVMPQTREAINHARAANVPIIVAVNKVDLESAQVDRVKQQLADLGLVPEEWGGDTVFVEVSAKKKTGIDLLLEMILLVSDLQELKTDYDRLAQGVVLESRLDRTKGPVATVLLQAGVLRIGQPFIAGFTYGKVRALFDDKGQRLDMAKAPMPVEVLGFHDVPMVADPFQVIVDEARARQIFSYRQSKLRDQTLAKPARMTLEQLHQKISEEAVSDLSVIVKADVQGSVEVISETLQKLSSDKVRIKLIHQATGAVTETDVLLASASNAVIIGFNVRPERKAQELAEKENVDIRLYTVIYNLTRDIQSAMLGLLQPETRETLLGRAEVREIFRVSKVGNVAGCSVLEGRMVRDASARLLRDNVVVYEGRLQSLRRFKDDVQEVRAGVECGIALEKYQDVKPGDVIEAYKTEVVKAETGA